MIALEGVSVHVNGRPILSTVDFAAESGQIVAVRGRNGSGKSTLLRCLAGLLRPTSGNVTIAGKAPQPAATWFRRSVAVMIDPPPFARDLTVAEHLGLVSLTWNGPTDLSTTVEELLARWGLGDCALRFPHELSSGQRQLLSLGILAARPSEVIIVDEPEQRLDAVHVELLATHLREFAARGNVVVMATHSDRLQEQTRARAIRLATHE